MSYPIKHKDLSAIQHYSGLFFHAQCEECKREEHIGVGMGNFNFIQQMARAPSECCGNVMNATRKFFLIDCNYELFYFAKSSGNSDVMKGKIDGLTEVKMADYYTYYQIQTKEMKAEEIKEIFKKGSALCSR